MFRFHKEPKRVRSILEMVASGQGMKVRWLWMWDVMYALATSNLTFRDSFLMVIFWATPAILLVISSQFLFICRLGTNQMPRSPAGPSVKRPTTDRPTLEDGMSVLLQIPKRKPAYFSWLIFASVTASYSFIVPPMSSWLDTMMACRLKLAATKTAYKDCFPRLPKAFY